MVELLGAALGQCYKDWLMREDPVMWFRQRRFGGSPEDSLPEAVASISHDRLRACRAELQDLRARNGSLETRARELLALPDNTQITRSYLEAASAVESVESETWQNLLERIHWLSKVLRTDALGSVHEMALRETRRCYEAVLPSVDRRKVEDCLHETFATLRQASPDYA